MPAVDLRVQEQSISNFLKDDGMASKMYAITSGELSIDELKPLQQNMLNNLIAVSQYESSLGTADKDDYGVIKHSNANTVGMFGLQEGTVKTLHDNGTLDRSITWDKISTDPVLANSAIPTIVNVAGIAPARTVTLSPTLKPFPSAVGESMTTSLLFVGG